VVKEGVRVGNLAPNFSLPTVDGATVTLGELRGRPVLVDFGATWCPSCRLDYPHLAQLYGQREGLGVEVLVVSIAEDRAIVEEFRRSSGVPFDYVLDEGMVARQYRIVSLPTKYFIDGSGVIRQVHAGPMSYEAMLSGLEAMR
jgi:peroxiredoxin